ncbi:MAG TPA: carboxypeptidase-like regulatory domain-containing protein, partial [Acidobacteriota bacterium]|nr:carboxypeptidase-like regulatory domain-containing protein [Acidobacteriota bacterium]
MKSATAVLIAGLALSALVLCPPRMVAQGLFGTIGGTVTDPSGAVIPGATVRVTNINTNATTILATNSAGVYSATNLNPGSYNIEAESPGFKKAVARNIVLEVNALLKIDLTLAVGETSEVVEITSEAPLLQTQQSSAGQTVNQKQLEDLPVQSGMGRSFYSLVSLAAGVTQQVGQGYDLDNMRINGGRPRMDDYLLDGTSVQQPVWGGPAVTPSVDSVQELRVETNSFSAEYGKVSGGVISA